MTPKNQNHDKNAHEGREKVAFEMNIANYVRLKINKKMLFMRSINNRNLIN